MVSYLRNVIRRLTKMLCDIRKFLTQYINYVLLSVILYLKV